MTNANNNDVLRSPCLSAHVGALRKDTKGYIAAIDFQMESGTFSAVPSGTRTSMMVALHAMSQHKALTRVMLQCDVAEILKAVTLLDDRRLSRQLARKIQKIENDHPHLMRLPEDETDSTSSHGDGRKRKSRRKVDVYRRKLRAVDANLNNSCSNKPYCDSDAHDNTAVQEIIQSAPGISGAFARKVRKWAKATQTSDALEYIMLMGNGKAPWRKLADLVHFHPSDFAVDYFLADVHDDPIPETCFVARLRAILNKYENDIGNHKIVDEFVSLTKEFPQVYLAFPFLRLQHALMNQPDIVKNLASHMPLETALWNFEELHRTTRNVDVIVLDRLKQYDFGSGSGNVKATTYGKLMERVLAFQRMGLDDLAKAVLVLASGRLEELKSYWQERVKGLKVAVIGDASASMQMAIQSATIFASLCSICLDGELSFYNGEPISSPFLKPRDVKQALVVCDKVRASGCTSPAAALWSYVEKKQLVDLIVHVTDEEENTPYNGESHASLLARYKEEVNPNVKIVIVCVGQGDQQFRSNLKLHNIEYRVVTIDEYRPDLAKFDSLLGQLVTAAAVDVDDVDRAGGESVDEFVVV